MNRLLISAVALTALAKPALASPVDPTNLAASGTVSASAFWEDNPLFEPTKAIDGSTFDADGGGNYWLLPNQTPGWWQVDLGSDVPIGLIRILNCNNDSANDRATKDFRLEIVDAAGTVVHTTADVLPFTSFSSAANPTTPYVLDLPAPVSGRYVRIWVDSWYPTRSDPAWPFPVISGSSDNEGGGLNEVQVFAAAGDTTKPTLAPVSDHHVLWPPNHQMVNVLIAANAADDSGQVHLSASVSSNEPVDGRGDGHTAPDWTEPVIDQATGIIRLQLRAERSVFGNGRIYSIEITATDPSGNASTATVYVTVPLSLH
jgi:F5/8 type C domain